MGTSMGAAIDWLVATLPEAIAAIDPSAVVVDNEPAVTAQSLVVIGRTEPENALAADGTQLIVVLGANRREEEYLIPCFVSVYRPGPAQKPARDAALALFDAVAHLVASDPTLGGVLLQGRSAYIEKAQLVQTRDAADTGAAGAMRLAIVAFDIHCKNHYIP
jgi:hypothetical protein